jgi:hypothetical protein
VGAGPAGGSDFNESAGTFLRVDVDDGGWFAVKAHEESVVLKAVSDYREKGRDCLVDVEDRYGCTVHLVASTVTCVLLSTPANRVASLMEEIRQEEWDRGFRKQHATPEWGEAA